MSASLTGGRRWHQDGGGLEWGASGGKGTPCWVATGSDCPHLTSLGMGQLGEGLAREELSGFRKKQGAPRPMVAAS